MCKLCWADCLIYDKIPKRSYNRRIPIVPWAMIHGIHAHINTVYVCCVIIPYSLWPSPLLGLWMDVCKRRRRRRRRKTHAIIKMATNRKEETREEKKFKWNYRKNANIGIFAVDNISLFFTSFFLCFASSYRIGSENCPLSTTLYDQTSKSFLVISLLNIIHIYIYFITLFSVAGLVFWAGMVFGRL